MKLMIVDDNPKVRQIIKEMFMMDFQSFAECSSGKEALENYQLFKPDWILMDIKMKEMNGIKAASELLKYNPEAKIIIITNYSDVSFRVAAKKAGAIEFFLKENLNTIPMFIKNYHELETRQNESQLNSTKKMRPL